MELPGTKIDFHSQIETDKQPDNPRRQKTYAERVEDIMKRVDREVIESAWRTALEIEALRAERKLNTEKADRAHKSILKSCRLEGNLDLMFDGFVQGIRESQEIWNQLCPKKKENNVARELQLHPEALVSPDEFSSALGIMFSKIVYVPGHVPSLDLAQAYSDKVLKKVKFHVELGPWIKDQLTSSPRPDHIYPIILATHIDSEKGLATPNQADFDQIIEKINQRNRIYEMSLERSDLEFKPMTMAEYVCFHLSTYNEKGVLYDAEIERSPTILAGERFDRSAGMLGAYLYQPQKALRFDFIASGESHRQRFILGKK